MLYENLLIQIQKAIKSTILKKKIGVAFSGGVDSTLLAKLCSDLGYDTTLFTVGFKNSHDIIFSKHISKLIKLPHKTIEIDNDVFHRTVDYIKNKVESTELSLLENCIAFYYISKLSKNFTNVLVTANGIDELFCGYDIYRRMMQYENITLPTLINTKLKNEIMIMKKACQITLQSDVRLINPFLFNDFINYAKRIPLHYKINGYGDFMRKHIIRTLAYKIGVPKISAYKRKKAMQYGTLIHKYIRRL